MSVNIIADNRLISAASIQKIILIKIIEIYSHYYGGGSLSIFSSLKWFELFSFIADGYNMSDS
jgi:hypothetical protein